MEISSKLKAAPGRMSEESMIGLLKGRNNIPKIYFNANYGYVGGIRNYNTESRFWRDVLCSFSFWVSLKEDMNDALRINNDIFERGIGYVGKCCSCSDMENSTPTGLPAHDGFYNLNTNNLELQFKTTESLQIWSRILLDLKDIIKTISLWREICPTHVIEHITTVFKWWQREGTFYPTTFSILHKGWHEFDTELDRFL